MKQLEPITIEKNSLGFTVRQGDRYADGLCWDEMLGLLCELTFPKDFSHNASWMMTEEQHRASEYWRYRDEEEKPKETLLLK